MAVNVFDDNAVGRIRKAVRHVEALRGDSTDGPATPHQRYHFIEGKLDGALAVGGTATLSVYAGDGANWADTTDNVTVSWPSGVGWAVASGKWLLAIWINGEWRPIAADC